MFVEPLKLEISASKSIKGEIYASKNIKVLEFKIKRQFGNRS